MSESAHYRVFARDHSYTVPEPPYWIGCAASVADAQAIVRSCRVWQSFTYFDIVRYGGCS